MIATIVFGLLVIIGIVFLVLTGFEHDKKPILYELGAGMLFVAIVIEAISLVFGYGITKKDLPLDRDSIVILLENNPYDANALKMAKEYNDKISTGNNYWCRFSLKDIEEININYYLDQAKEK